MRRLLPCIGLPLLAGAVPACLLFTDDINAPPEPAIEGPGVIYAGDPAVFRGMAPDPDGDAVTLAWSDRPGRCKELGPKDWAGVKQDFGGETHMVDPKAHQPVCVRLLARDARGAEAIALAEATPANREPRASLAVMEPKLAGSFYPLYSAFQLSAAGSCDGWRANEPCKDQDSDALTLAFDVRDGAGASVTLAACDLPNAPPGSVKCFQAMKAGLYTAKVSVSDGMVSSMQMLNLPVAEDQPPCIGASDPAVETSLVVLSLADPPRRFEVKRVIDETHPFPPGPLGAASFYWYVARETGGWTRLMFTENRSPTLDVSAGLFNEDVRPGSTFRVRVEVRDPEREKPLALSELASACQDRPLCEHPAGCVRWATWSVQFR